MTLSIVSNVSMSMPPSVAKDFPSNLCVSRKKGCQDQGWAAATPVKSNRLRRSCDRCSQEEIDQQTNQSSNNDSMSTSSGWSVDCPRTNGFSILRIFRVSLGSRIQGLGISREGAGVKGLGFENHKRGSVPEWLLVLKSHLLDLEESVGVVFDLARQPHCCDHHVLRMVVHRLRMS